MKLHVSLQKIYHLRDNNTYKLEIYTQPTWRRILARIYHWYDMRIFKAPGFRSLENWLERRHGGDPLLYIPLSAQQDIRCYDLNEAGRKLVVQLDITDEQYQGIQAARRGKTDPSDTV